MRGFDVYQLVGQVLDSRYRVEEHLGSGAMGSVFRARHVRLSRSFAIKLLHPRLLSDPKLLKRFEREARLAGKLSHPNVISVLDVGEIDGISFMVMDLAVGATLTELFAHAPFERARAIRLIRQLCDGLDHAHYHGVIHRDLKPDNVIVESRGDEEVARIVDFGIAILREPDPTGGGPEGRVTTGGVVLGTPQYMAPELATGRPIDHRADLFALGVICYEMLTGKMPFDGSGVDAAYANVQQDAPPMAIRAPTVTVDADLEAFTLRMMTRDPDGRPPTAAAARAWIDRIERSATTRNATTKDAAVPAVQPSPSIAARRLTPPEAYAIGSAKTVAIATLERPVVGSDAGNERTPPDPKRPPRRR